MQQQQPDLYQQEFEYLDDFLIKYHLFHQQIDAVGDDLSRFQSNPVQGIDQLGAVLDDLQFYGATEPLVALCRAAYQPVAESTKVLGGAEIKFANVIIFDLFERAFQQLQQSETVDWDSFKTESSQYGLTNGASKWTEIEHHLTVDVSIGEEYAQQFKQDLGGSLRHLLLNFCRDMQTEHHMSFVCSRGIWEAILEFLDTQEPSEKQMDHPDGYFDIDPKKLDRHLGHKLAGLLSMQQSKGFAIVWGMPYLYAFLQSKQIISEDVAQQAISTAQACKTQLAQVLKHRLWEYDFVHRWPRPDSVSEAEFAEESELFAASIEQATPLSDKPIEKPYAKLLGLADKEKTTDPSSKSPTKPLKAVAQPTPPKAGTFQKRRKSPLQEAKGLDKSKRSGKKKPGKGFN